MLAYEQKRTHFQLLPRTGSILLEQLLITSFFSFVSKLSKKEKLEKKNPIVSFLNGKPDHFSRFFYLNNFNHPPSQQTLKNKSFINLKKSSRELIYDSAHISNPNKIVNDDSIN